MGRVEHLRRQREQDREQDDRGRRCLERCRKPGTGGHGAADHVRRDDDALAGEAVPERGGERSEQRGRHGLRDGEQADRGSAARAVGVDGERDGRELLAGLRGGRSDLQPGEDRTGPAPARRPHVRRVGGR